MSHGRCQRPPQALDVAPARAKHWEADGTRSTWGRRRFLGSDCLDSSKEEPCNQPQYPPQHEVPERGAQDSPSPRSHPQLTTRRQDRGQRGGLSFILKPQWVASLRQRRRGSDGDGTGRQAGSCSPPSRTGLDGNIERCHRAGRMLGRLGLRSPALPSGPLQALAEVGAPYLGPASQGSFPVEEGLPASSINSQLP